VAEIKKSFSKALSFAYRLFLKEKMHNNISSASAAPTFSIRQYKAIFFRQVLKLTNIVSLVTVARTPSTFSCSLSVG
jgi:hypothetical protein